MPMRNVQQQSLLDKKIGFVFFGLEVSRMNTIYLAIHIFGLQKAIYQLHYTRISMASVCIKTEFIIVFGEEEQWWRAE